MNKDMQNLYGKLTVKFYKTGCYKNKYLFHHWEI